MCNVHCTLCNVGLQQAAVAVVAVPAGYGAEDEASQEDGGKDYGFVSFLLSWCWKMFSVVFQPNSKFSDLLFCILAINISPSCLHYSTFLKQIPVLICFGILSYQRTFCQLKP